MANILGNFGIRKFTQSPSVEYVNSGKLKSLFNKGLKDFKVVDYKKKKIFSSLTTNYSQ